MGFRGDKEPVTNTKQLKMTAMYNRTYENSYEDIANGLPLKRSPEVEKDSAYSNLPASYRKGRSSSRSISPGKNNTVVTGEAGRELRSLKREVAELEKANAKLLKSGDARNKQVEALDDLLQRERQALQEVLAAARKRVNDVEQERDELHDSLTLEIEKVMGLEQAMIRMQEDHSKQVSVLTKQNNDMRGELIKAREQMKHIAEKAAKDLAAERDNHARTVHGMKLDFQEAESRWGDDRLVLETKIVDQMSLLRIWREIIADLRLRLRFLQMWIWGFRRWHYNVVQNQMDAYEELPEPEPAPKREEWNIDAWDIYAIAASEFVVAVFRGHLLSLPFIRRPRHLTSSRFNSIT